MGLALGTATAAKLALPRNIWIHLQVGADGRLKIVLAESWSVASLSWGNPTVIMHEDHWRPMNSQS